MSSTLQSQHKQKAPLSTLTGTLPSRNTLSINKLPPSHISNGNSILSKYHKPLQKVEPLPSRPAVHTPLKVSKDESKEGLRAERTPFNSWIRPGNEERQNMAWGVRPSGASKDNLASEDIPSE